MKNAEKYVAETILSSCLAMPRTAAKAIFAGAVAQTAGSAARAASDTIAARQGKDESPLEPGTASLALLGLTADDVVLVNGRRGMLKPVATGWPDADREGASSARSSAVEAHRAASALVGGRHRLGARRAP
jgi:hypothetical protein